jgi:hypothetical protein
MAACGLRNIRYVAFPPVVFETPAPVATPEPLPAPETEPAPMLAEASPQPIPEWPEVAGAPLPAEPMTSTPPVPVLAEPVRAAPAEPAAVEVPPAELPVAAMLPATPLTPSPRPDMRRLAEFDAEVAAQFTRPRRGAPLDAPPPGLITEADAPAGAVPVRNYALLRDIAVELRPRRGRARGGKRA